MGISGSKQRLPRVASSSAAFGRLRIDSPGAATPGSARSAMSIRRRQQMRLAEQQASGSSPIMGSGFGGGRIIHPTEVSPLISGSTLKEPVANLHALGTNGRQLSSSDGLEIIGSPPLQVWIVPALCCAMAYALYNIFIKKGSSHINPVLGGVILQLVAAVLGCCLLMFLVWKEGGAEVVVYDMEGIHWAILAGLAVGTAEIVSFFVSSLGVQAMQSIPIIIGGSVMFGTVLGAVALHEELSIRGWSGVVLISVGIGLVGMDSEGEL